MLPVGYTESRNETTLLTIDGSIGLLYVVNNQGEELPYELRYDRPLPSEVLP